MCVCVCVCVRVRARARVRTRACVYKSYDVPMGMFPTEMLCMYKSKYTPIVPYMFMLHMRDIECAHGIQWFPGLDMWGDVPIGCKRLCGQ